MLFNKIEQRDNDLNDYYEKIRLAFEEIIKGKYFYNIKEHYHNVPLKYENKYGNDNNSKSAIIKEFDGYEISHFFAKVPVVSATILRYASKIPENLLLKIKFNPQFFSISHLEDAIEGIVPELKTEYNCVNNHW